MLPFMNQKFNFVSISLLFCLGMSSVSCLKCHVCSTTKPGQDDCEAVEKQHTKYLEECMGHKNASCSTQDQWVDFEVLNQKTGKRTIRQCSSIPFDTERPCYYRTGFGGKTNVCNCIGDGCNEAPRTASTLSMTLSIFVLAKLIAINGRM